MSIGDRFEKFCNNIRFSDEVVATIRLRYKEILKRLNLDFWSTYSDSQHGMYVGSYGRGTSIHASDIDMIYILPFSYYQQYNNYKSNGQSALLQTVKEHLLQRYPNTTIRGDGQVVVVTFSDGVRFEILPCFEQAGNNALTYPDTHYGGSWKSTNPRAEIAAINELNGKTNKNLKRLCRMVRAWKDCHSVSISGLLIDTLAHNFLSKWEYSNKGFLYYDWMTRDFFKYLSGLNSQQKYWHAPGSNQQVYSDGYFVQEARRAYDRSLQAIEHEDKGYTVSADNEWREIYGYRFKNYT